MKNLVTVYIINSNYGKYISQAIQSVLNQTYKNIEILIIDDFSSDNSKKIIKKYVSNPKIKIIGVQPEEGASIPGIRKWPKEYVPKIFSDKNIDEIIYISQDQAENTARNLAKKEGIFSGPSSGGTTFVALEIAKKEKNAVIVSIICDRGDRYISTGIFNK